VLYDRITGLTEKETYNHPVLRESYKARVKVLEEIRKL